MGYGFRKGETGFLGDCMNGHGCCDHMYHLVCDGEAPTEPCACADGRGPGVQGLCKDGEGCCEWGMGWRCDAGSSALQVASKQPGLPTPPPVATCTCTHDMPRSMGYGFRKGETGFLGDCMNGHGCCDHMYHLVCDGEAPTEPCACADGRGPGVQGLCKDGEGCCEWGMGWRCDVTE